MVKKITEQDQLSLEPDVILVNEGQNASRNLVTKSNKLITGFSRLSLNEQKLLATAISMINPMGEVKEGSLLQVELHAHEIAALTGIKISNIYRFIDEAAQNYHKIPIETPGKKPGDISYINIAYKSEYRVDDKTFSIIFHPLMIPELVNLKKKFTTYGLEHLVKLTSKYSARLYELIKKGPNPVTYKLWDENNLDSSLYFCLGLKDYKGKDLIPSYTKQFFEFERRVLQLAVEDISNKTDIIITYEVIKRGKTATAVRFAYSSKAQGKDVINSLGEFGFSSKDIQTLRSKYADAIITKNIEMYHRIKDSHNIKKPAAYLRTLIDRNAAELPDFANPYSDLYKTDRTLRSFIELYIMPIWWQLPDHVRDSLESLKFLSPVIKREYAIFKRATEEGNIEEVFSLMSDRDSFIEELIESSVD